MQNVYKFSGRRTQAPRRRKQNFEGDAIIEIKNLWVYEDSCNGRSECYFHFIHEAMVCTQQILVIQQNYVTRYISPFSPGPEILLRFLKKLILIVQKSHFFQTFLGSLRFSLFFAHVTSRFQFTYTILVASK